MSGNHVDNESSSMVPATARVADLPDSDAWFTVPNTAW